MTLQKIHHAEAVSKPVIANDSEAILYIKALIYRLLQNCVFPNDVVFDSFETASLVLEKVTTFLRNKNNNIYN